MASALARSQLAECDTKLARHRAALEAGADPTIVTGWIAEVEAERRRILSALKQHAPGDRRLTREEITAMVQQLGDIIDVLREADLADRAEVYQQLGLRLTYHPDERKVRVQSSLPAHPCGESVRVRGGMRTPVRSFCA